MTRQRAIKSLSIKRRSTQKVRALLLSGLLVVAALISPVQTIFAADPTYEWSRNDLIGVSHIRWSDIASSADGTKLAAVAYGNVIYTSADSGAHWVRRESSGIHNWSAIASSADGTKLVAVVDSGHIYTSADSGASWIERTNAGTTYWYDVASSADGNKLMAVGFDNYIQISSDAGENWTPYIGEPDQYWAAVAVSGDGTKTFAASDGGYVYASTDDTNWTPIGTVTGRWNSLAVSADGSKVVAVSYGDTFYTSVNGGEWVRNDEASAYSVAKATMSADGMHMAVGGRNAPIFVSTNGGEEWTPRDVEDGSWDSIVYSADGTRLTATLGSAPYIRTSTDDAVSWVNNVIRGAGDWQKIFASNDGTILVAYNDFDGIYRSTDGGVHWTPHPFDDNMRLVRLAMSANGQVLAGIDLDTNILYTSSDGGETWIDHPVTGGELAVSADGTRIILMSDTDIHISTNGGGAWVSYSAVTPTWLNKFSVSADGMTLMGSDNNGHVYRSVNGGETWAEVIVDADATYWVDSTISADGDTMMVSSEEALYVSIDGGTTWVEQAGLPSNSWTALAASMNGQTLVAASMGGDVWISTNSGDTWHRQEINSINNQWNSVASSADGTKLFATEYGGYVYQTPAPEQNDTPPEEETPPQEETPIPPVVQPPVSNTSSLNSSAGVIKTTISPTVSNELGVEESTSLPTVDLMKESAFRAGDEYKVAVASGQVLSFKANEAPHTFTVDSIQGNTVTFTIRSTPQTHALRVGETGKYDVDGDKTDDISVTVNGVTNGVAQLTMVNLLATNVSVLSIPQEEASDTTETKATKSGLDYGLIAWIAGGVVALLIAILIIRKTKRT